MICFDDTFGTFEPEYPPPHTTRWDGSVMKCNTPSEQIIENIRSSLKRNLPQLQPYDTNDQVLAIVGGGWSLNETAGELREVLKNGAKAVALNGSAAWLMGRGIRPSMHILLDARVSNARFVEGSVPKCKYFLASQCHPDVFDACRGETYIYHAISQDGEAEKKIIDEYYHSRPIDPALKPYGGWIRLATAGTVGLVSLFLLRVLGFRRHHLFGFDSCCSPDGKHHGYQQRENDRDVIADFWTAGRAFPCTAAQATQAQNFTAMMAADWNDLDLEIHGDGVLAHIVTTAVWKAQSAQIEPGTLTECIRRT